LLPTKANLFFLFTSMFIEQCDARVTNVTEVSMTGENDVL